MATDWAADVRKYVPEADDAIIGGIVRFCGIALNSRDSALVAFSDKDELARVRDSFLKKKLGLKQADEALDAAISEVGKRLKGVRNRNRVTVYYLLAESLGKLSAFEPKVKTAEKKTEEKSPAKPAKAAKAPAKGAKAPSKTATPAKGTQAKPAALKPAGKTKAAAKAKAPVTLKLGVEAQVAPLAAMETTEPAPAPIAPQPLAVAGSATSAPPAQANGAGLWWFVLAITVAILIWYLFLW